MLLRDVMRSQRAWDEIRQRQIHSTPTDDYIFQLYLDATGDEDIADRMATRYLLDLIRAGYLKE